MRRREAERQVNAPHPAPTPARRVPAVPSTHPVRLSAALHPASTSQAKAHMQLGKAGRKKHSVQCIFCFLKPVSQTDKSKLLDAGPSLDLSAGQQRKSKASWAFGVQNTAALFPAVPANHHLFFPCLTVLLGTLHFAPQI